MSNLPIRKKTDYEMMEAKDIRVGFFAYETIGMPIYNSKFETMKRYNYIHKFCGPRFNKRIKISYF